MIYIASPYTSLIDAVREDRARQVSAFAAWKASKQELKVEALSSAAPDAVLTVVGFGEMTLKGAKYVLKIKPVANPGTVTVISDFGGTDTATVTVQ